MKLEKGMRAKGIIEITIGDIHAPDAMALMQEIRKHLEPHKKTMNFMKLLYKFNIKSSSYVETPILGDVFDTFPWKNK